MAWDRFQRTGRADTISVDFYTGAPAIFSVKKYADALEELRIQRGVGIALKHNLISVNSEAHKATFKTADGSVDVDYTLLHVSPPMGPLGVMKGQPIVDAAGWVSVDKGTLRHTNPEYGNVWALGDCSNLPTSKTAAAVTGQAPVLTENLFSVVDTGKLSSATYDGYTSCPVSSFPFFKLECHRLSLTTLAPVAADWLRAAHVGRVQVRSGAQRVFRELPRRPGYPASSLLLPQEGLLPLVILEFHGSCRPYNPL